MTDSNSTEELPLDVNQHYILKQQIKLWY